MPGFPALQVLALCEAMACLMVGSTFAYRTSSRPSRREAGMASGWDVGGDGVDDRRERRCGGGGLGCYKRVMPVPLTTGVCCWTRMWSRKVIPPTKIRLDAVIV